MSYNTVVLDNYVMKVSSNGQVSIPAPARARWQADRVVVVDLGDRVVLRPLPGEPVAALVGRYRDAGVTTDGMRRRARADDADRERRRRG
jgi:bifunctional DNA-binding transcriptional regulator/antitoxin component of YhaV-PrlF toxin-antitoxin module